MSPELYYCRGQFGLIKMDLFVTVFGGLNGPLYWGQTPVPSQQALSIFGPLQKEPIQLQVGPFQKMTSLLCVCYKQKRNQNTV